MLRFVRWTLSIAAVLLLAATWQVSGGFSAAEQTSEPADSPVASLQAQLEKGLRARRPIEFQFVRQVAQMVENGQLPRPLVVGTFAWTRQKYRGQAYLVPHFEMVLRRRAAEEKITVLDGVPSTVVRVE